VLYKSFKPSLISLSSSPFPRALPSFTLYLLIVSFFLCKQPVGFFEANPALDVPPSTQLFNKSTSADVPCCKKANL
jgi:hypothetical protein